MTPNEEEYFSNLYGQAVESLGHWNVSIGGFDVNGINGPQEKHPIVRLGQAAVEPLLTRIRESPFPLREILLLNAITGRESTRLENSIISMEEPSAELVADERRRILAEHPEHHV